MVELVTVITLPEEGRVKCQHDGCGRNVFAQVHVIRRNGNVSFVGSTCFRRLFGDLDLQSSFGGKAGIPLTNDEREQILHNTESFLAQLKTAYEPSAFEIKPSLTSALEPAIGNLEKVPYVARTGRGQPTHIHLFRCLTCSTRLINYEFESTERMCPQCNKADDVFTIEKYPI
jgi:hypothetical protein